jgi:hypothetical protein
MRWRIRSARGSSRRRVVGVRFVIVLSFCFVALAPVLALAACIPAVGQSTSKRYRASNQHRRADIRHRCQVALHHQTARWRIRSAPGSLQCRAVSVSWSWSLVVGLIADQATRSNHDNHDCSRVNGSGRGGLDSRRTTYCTSWSLGSLEMGTTVHRRSRWGRRGEITTAGRACKYVLAGE